MKCNGNNNSMAMANVVMLHSDTKLQIEPDQLEVFNAEAALGNRTYVQTGEVFGVMTNVNVACMYGSIGEDTNAETSTVTVVESK
ncbi:hypothetical protein BLOT_003005 [Blomia tropicalis]|nr:hypothetical protein BLOT_003005 [Blomia tropicalis]